MRGSARLVACVVVMLVGTAQPADAFWRWLEHMSGPGWFNGLSIEFKEWGRYPDLPGSEATVLDVVKAETSLARLRALLRAERRRDQPRAEVVHALVLKIKTMAKTEGLIEESDLHPRSVVFSPPLSDDRRIGDIRQPRTWTVGWSGGVMWSTINRLQYDPSVPPEDTQVWVLTGGPFFDRRLSGLLDRVEVGGSVEGYFFFGKTTRKMFRVAIEPRAAVTLGTIRDEASENPALSVKLRAGVLWIPKGFTREDFGALPGEPLGTEVLTSVRIVLDFDCFPWRQGAC